MRKSNFDGNNFQFFEDILRKKRSHAEEGLSLLERGEIEYIKSGLYQKICSIPAQDALKNGYEICDSNEDILEDENSDIGWLEFNELIAKSDESFMIPVYEKIIEKIKKLYL